MPAIAGLSQRIRNVNDNARQAIEHIRHCPNRPRTSDFVHLGMRPPTSIPPAAPGMKMAPIHITVKLCSNK